MKFVLILGMLVFGAMQNASAGIDCKCSCSDFVASGSQSAETTTTMFNRAGGCAGIGLPNQVQNNLNEARDRCKNICKNSGESNLRSNASQACAVANKLGDWWIVNRAQASGASWKSGWHDSGKPNKMVHCNQQCDGGTIIGGKCFKVPANVQGAPNKGFGEYYTWNNGLFKKAGTPTVSCPAGAWNDTNLKKCVKSLGNFKNEGIPNQGLGNWGFIWDGSVNKVVGVPSLNCPAGQWLGDNNTRCHSNATPDNVAGAPNTDLGPWGIVSSGKVYKHTPGPVVGSF